MGYCKLNNPNSRQVSASIFSKQVFTKYKVFIWPFFNIMNERVKLKLQESFLTVPCSDEFNLVVKEKNTSFLRVKIFLPVFHKFYLVHS